MVAENILQLDALSRVMQASVAPALMISAAGLLLLTMTNRLATAISRVRQLTQVLGRAPEDERMCLSLQISILFRRSRILQTAITFLVFSIFFIGLVVLMLFSGFSYGVEVSSLIRLVFTISLVCLATSLGFFLADIRLTLKSLKIEISQAEK